MAEHRPRLAGDAAASIQGLMASGPRAGHPVRRLRSAAAVVDEGKPRCARLEGVSLHANVAVPAHARERLEHGCRSLLRPPLARERLTDSSHGQRRYELAHPRADGSPHLLLDPLVEHRLARLAFRDAPRAVDLLAAGIEGNPTTAIALGIDALVEAARPLTPIFLAAPSTRELLLRLEAEPDGPARLAAFREFLTRRRSPAGSPRP